MTLYLDLDGVFVDFFKGARELTGHPHELDVHSSWINLDHVDNFFWKLDPLPGSKEFFDEIVGRSRLPVQILTALPQLTGKLHTAVSDKTNWVHKHLGRVQVNCVQGRAGKAIFATCKDTVLVDDTWHNIERWCEAGSAGIHHISQSDTLRALASLGVLKSTTA